MTRVLVAAGGGGDALAAALLHHTVPFAAPAVIATYAWDHLVVDPVPGPRSASDFTALAPMAGRDRMFTPGTRPVPPAGSTLPRLSGEIGDRLVLLDPDGAAAGLCEQLGELVHAHDADEVEIVDVGGDSLARGDESGLRSPLADAMVLAACAGLDVPSSIMVAGPGLDGELTEDEVLAAAATATTATAGSGTADARPDRVLGPDDIAPFAHVLDWHPTESTALLAAAAQGVRGRVEIRDRGLIVPLTTRSADVYRLELATVLGRSRVASALIGSSSLDEAETITRTVCGFSELEYERRKAAAPSPPDDRDQDQLAAAVRDLERTATDRGVDYLTFRRIAAALRLAAEPADRLRRHLVRTRPEHHVWPLWSVQPVEPVEPVQPVHPAQPTL
jgi:hypothetical protein